MTNHKYYSHILLNALGNKGIYGCIHILHILDGPWKEIVMLIEAYSPDFRTKEAKLGLEQLYEAWGESSVAISISIIEFG